MENQSARVHSIDALRAFRAALFKFAEAANIALSDADSEMQRVMIWLEHEQHNYWQLQVRKRTEALSRAKEAVRMKKLFKGSDGRQQSAVDEEKALVVAQRRHAEAEQKLRNVQSHSRKLPKEILFYKGHATRFATALQSDIPTAVAHLGRLINTLEQYVTLAAPGTAGGAGGAGPLVTSDLEAARAMTRGETAALDQGSRRWRYLRARTPAGATRETAPVAAGDHAGRALTLHAAVLTPLECEALASVKAEREPPDPQSKVVFAKACSEMSRIYLERTEVSFPGDSGWYAGPADDADADAAQAVSVADLVAARPDLAEILSLPRGFLAVLDGGGVAGLLDGQDLEQWTTEQPAEAAGQELNKEG